MVRETESGEWVHARELQLHWKPWELDTAKEFAELGFTDFLKNTAGEVVVWRNLWLFPIEGGITSERFRLFVNVSYIIRQGNLRVSVPIDRASEDSDAVLFCVDVPYFQQRIQHLGDLHRVIETMIILALKGDIDSLQDYAVSED